MNNCEEATFVEAMTVKVPDPLPLFQVTVSNVIYQCRACVSYEHQQTSLDQTYVINGQSRINRYIDIVSARALRVAHSEPEHQRSQHADCGSSESCSGSTRIGQRNSRSRDLSPKEGEASR